MKKIMWDKLLLAIGIPLAVGALSAFLSRSGMQGFSELTQPPLSPPGWLFPIVWTVLYVLMGIASYLVYLAKDKNALKIYALQLVFNFFWSIIFFRFGAYLFAFIWLLCLWGTVLWTLIRFFKANKTAGKLLIPYLVWVTFAGYLNLGIYILN